MPTGSKIHRGFFFFKFHHLECLINNKKQEVPESFTTAYTCTKYVCRWNAFCSGGSSGWTQQEKSAGTADVDQVSWHFCTGTPMRNPVCLQATRRALIHRQPSHRGKLGKKPDGLGKKAVSIKAELTFLRKEIGNSIKSGTDKSWNQCLLSAGKWRQCWVRRESHKYRKQTEE